MWQGGPVSNVYAAVEERPFQAALRMHPEMGFSLCSRTGAKAYVKRQVTRR
jgi:hypothetical protein